MFRFSFLKFSLQIRHPAYQNDPVADFHPIENGNVHFVDIKNNELTVGLHPYQKSFELWAMIDNEIAKINADDSHLREEL